MRWITAAVCVSLLCIAFACDKSDSKTNSANDLPPDLKEPNFNPPPTTAPAVPPAPTPKAAPTSAPATQTSAMPINKFCAVETKNKIDPKVTFTYQGKVIGFCCPDCIPDFQKDPAKYMASLK